MKNTPQGLRIIFFINLMLLSFSANALLPYKYDWVQIKSPHFSVIVDKDYQEFGKLVAQKAEEAAKRLEALSNKRPRNTVIIVDHTKGYSNGSATMFPYPTIILQPGLPESSSQIGQYKDWVLELLIHEYTHILSFHNTRNLYSPMRWLVGSAISPSYFLPTWYLEGLAVYTESHLSDGGRLKTSKFNAYKNQLYKSNISFANEQETGSYPFGSAPYVFGSWLNELSISEKDSAQSLKQLNKLHKKLSGRFPFFLSSAYKSTTGDGLYKVWRETFNKKNKTTPLIESESQGDFPYWSSDHQALYFIQLDPYQFNEIVEQKDKKKTVLINDRNILRYKVTEDKIYYNTLTVQKQDQRLYRVKSYDFKTKNTQTLDFGENIKNFDVFQNKVIYVDTKINQQSLFIYDLDTKKSKLLFQDNEQGRIELPRFQTATEVIYVHKKNNSPETVLKTNINAFNPSPIFTADHINFLSFYKNSLLVLHEDQSHKLITLIDKNKTLKTQHEVNNFYIKNLNEIYVSRITNSGAYLDKFSSFKELTSNQEKEPIYVASTQSSENSNEINLKTKNYSSFYKMAPHYLMPGFTYSPYGLSGEYLVSVSTGGKDPLGLNNYNILVFTDTATKKASYDFSYTSNHLRTPISFNTGTFNEPLSLSIFRKTTYANLGFHLPFTSSFSDRKRLSFGLFWNSTPVANINTQRAGVSLSLNYETTNLRARELAPRSGIELFTSYKYNAPISDYYDYGVGKLGFTWYLKPPLFDTHRLIFKLNSGIFSESINAAVFTENSLNQSLRTSPSGSFLMRGVPTGSLLATDSYITGHLEYRFPLLKVNWGPGLLPAFFNRVTGAFTADYGSYKGVDLLGSTGSNIVRRTHSTPLYSAGAELVFDGKAIYHIPVSFQIGYYKFLNTDFYDGDPEIFVGLSMGFLPQ